MITYIDVILIDHNCIKVLSTKFSLSERDKAILFRDNWLARHSKNTAYIYEVTMKDISNDK
jgi:hypothetical protein